MRQVPGSARERRALEGRHQSQLDWQLKARALRRASGARKSNNNNNDNNDDSASNKPAAAK